LLFCWLAVGLAGCSQHRPESFGGGPVLAPSVVLEWSGRVDRYDVAVMRDLRTGQRMAVFERVNGGAVASVLLPADAPGSEKPWGP
jgi:hypothetical protein